MATARAVLFSDPKSEARKPCATHLRWGQVQTPEPISLRMAEWLLQNRTEESLRILDPCVGAGTFPRSLARCGLLTDGDELTLVDIDPKMIAESSNWAQAQGLKFSAKCGDYIELKAKSEYDCAILNPPYVRQEWLNRKAEYSSWFEERYNLRVPGTSNLYVYFIIKVLTELRPGGRLACIVFDSWQFTRFGNWLAQILETECDEITMAPEGNQPFSGRLIDATVIYARKRRSTKSGPSGSSLLGRADIGPLSTVDGFCALTDLFESRRGLRLKQTDFFLCDLRKQDKRGTATPFVKKVSRFNGYQVPKDHSEAALLLSPGEFKPAVRLELRRRLREAKKRPQDNISILTWFKERRESWMLHRRPPYAQIIFNYYMRNRPKHILSPRHAYADNFYGLVARGKISPLAWLAVLNSTAVCVEILSRARNQGSGLAKVQLFEYRSVHVPNLQLCSLSEVRKFELLGKELLDRASPKLTLRQIDEVLANVFLDSRLRLPGLYDIFAETDKRARKPREAVACLG